MMCRRHHRGVMSAAAVALLLAALAASPDAAIEENRRVVAHVLDRVTFGATPGAVADVSRSGVRAYIERQLHPERIDDRALEARLAGFETLDLSTGEIAERYAIPAQEARRARQRARAASADPTSNDRPSASPTMSMERRQERQVLVELTDQKLLRAVYSERQLQEVLVDFWFNHFNVFAGKGVERFLLTSYERDVIRPHVLGSFRDLLGATSRSPAMLYYLDNWLSVDPDAALDLASRRRAARPNMRRSGLNENYARELLELHTLGVDGGYTQQDVTEVARVFTGWTIQDPRRGARFRFDARLHDNGEKVVLGHRIRGRGQWEGDEVLDLFASHPSTARFIATKLARRFVSDDPPPALVARAARRFEETDGDLREVTRMILTSPEFLDPDAYRAKIKSPFEFVVGAVRATEASFVRAGVFARSLQELGQPLYLSQPPTGYVDRADVWVNAGALVGRMNFALALANDDLPGVRTSLTRATSADVAATRARLVDDWLHGDVSPGTLETLSQASDVRQLVALTLGSPEFQKR